MHFADVVPHSAQRIHSWLGRERYIQKSRPENRAQAEAPTLPIVSPQRKSRERTGLDEYISSRSDSLKGVNAVGKYDIGLLKRIGTREWNELSEEEKAQFEQAATEFNQNAPAERSAEAKAEL